MVPDSITYSNMSKIQKYIKIFKKKIQKYKIHAVRWPLMASQAWPPTAPGPPECHPEPSLCCVVLCFFVICCILHIMLHCASCIVFCSSIDSFYSIEPEQKCTAVNFHMTVHVIQWSALQLSVQQTTDSSTVVPTPPLISWSHPVPNSFSTVTSPSSWLLLLLITPFLLKKVLQNTSFMVHIPS